MPLDKRLDWSQSGVGHTDEKKNLHPCHFSGHLVHSLVPVMTELLGWLNECCYAAVSI